MATDDKLTRFQNKQLIPSQSWRDNFAGYVTDKVAEVISHVYNQSGVLTSGGVDIISGGSASQFTFTPLPFDCIDNLTHNVMTVNDENGYGQVVFPQTFENTAASTYQVGIRFASVPDTVTLNPRTLNPEYQFDKDQVGDLGNPDASGISGSGPIKMYINGMLTGNTGAPHTSHAGRVARVMLVTPQSSDPTVAFQETTVAYDGGGNYVSVGTMGQASVSTAPEDYYVFCGGASIRNTTNGDPSISASNTYVFIGTITGHATLPTYSMTGQNDISISLADIDSKFTTEHDGVTGFHTDITADSATVEVVSVGGTTVNNKFTVNAHASEADGNAVAKVVNKNGVNSIVIFANGTVGFAENYSTGTFPTVYYGVGGNNQSGNPDIHIYHNAAIVGQQSVIMFGSSGAGSGKINANHDDDRMQFIPTSNPTKKGYFEGTTGNLSVYGTVSAGGISYDSLQAGYKSVFVHDFRFKNEANWTWNDEEMHFAADATEDFTIPLTLPHGVTITDFYVVAGGTFAGAETATLDAEMRYVSDISDSVVFQPTSTLVGTASQASFANPDTGLGKPAVKTGLAHVVDNGSRAYYIHGSITQAAGGDLRLYGAVVKYTYTDLVV